MRRNKKATRKNPFAGASDIYLTKNKLAVTTTANKREKRSSKKTTKTKYYVQNADNVKQLKAASGGTVRVGRTGNNYKNL